MVNLVNHGHIGIIFIHSNKVGVDMAREATEVIRVSPENWQKLNALKKPGESFNDVVTRLLEAEETDEE